MNFPFAISCRVGVVVAGVLGLLLFGGCTGGSEEVIDTVKDTVEDLSNGDEREFRPTCGVVGESLQESVKAQDGIFLPNASAIDQNVVAAVPASGPVVVKLLSLDFAGDPSEGAVARLNELVSGGVYLFQRPDPCSITTPDGAAGTSGQLITAEGIDVAEQLVREGLGGDVTASGNCGEEMLAACYETLQPSVPD